MSATIYQFWQKMQVDRNDEVFQAALQLQNPHPNLPAHLDAGTLEDLPDKAGIYIFYGENDRALYISKTKDIRKKVISHFAANKRSNQDKNLQQQIRRIDLIEIADEFAAKRKEALLMTELNPCFNSVKRKTANPREQ